MPWGKFAREPKHGSRNGAWKTRHPGRTVCRVLLVWTSPYWSSLWTCIVERVNSCLVAVDVRLLLGSLHAEETLGRSSLEWHDVVSPGSRHCNESAIRRTSQELWRRKKTQQWQSLKLDDNRSSNQAFSEWTIPLGLKDVAPSSLGNYNIVWWWLWWKAS